MMDWLTILPLIHARELLWKPATDFAGEGAMNSALIGALVFAGSIHLLLIAAPFLNTWQSGISLTSKLIWSVFLVGLPLLGVAVFHWLFKATRFQGPGFENSVEDERAKSGTLPSDREL